MKLYCAGAIRGEKSYEEYFNFMIKIASEHGEIFTEKSSTYFPLTKLSDVNKNKLKPFVHQRDIIKWLGKSDALLAEFSGASTGVGYEICYASRLLRIPCLCLFNSSSNASLMIVEDISKYNIKQKYFDYADLELYTTCFLEIIKKTKNIDEIRGVFYECAIKIENGVLDKTSLLYEIEKQLIMGDEKNVLQFQFNPDQENIYLYRSEFDVPNFKDFKDLSNFLFKNAVLQNKWFKLKSQRIGRTFLSGKKHNIIRILSKFKGPVTFMTMYNLLQKDHLSYSRFAFTKNLRAYSKIGLILTPYEVKRGSSKFKDKYYQIKTLDNKIIIKTYPSMRKKSLYNFLVITKHLFDLSIYLELYGVESILEIIEELQNKKWYNEINDINITNIDKIEISYFINKSWYKDMLNDVEKTSKKLWNKYYSSVK